MSGSTFRQRSVIIVVGVLLLTLLSVWWIVAMGAGYAGWVALLLLIVLVGLPFVVGRGLQHRRRFLKIWFGVLGFFVGLVVGAGLAELIDTLTHVPHPDPDIERFRMRIDILFGAIVGAAIVSSVGVLVGSKLAARNDQESSNRM